MQFRLRSRRGSANSLSARSANSAQSGGAQESRAASIVGTPRGPLETARSMLGASAPSSRVEEEDTCDFEGELPEVSPEQLDDLATLLMSATSARFDAVRDMILERLEELCLAGFKASEQFSELRRLLDPKARMRRDAAESGRGGGRSAKSRLSAVFGGGVLNRRGSSKAIFNARSSANHSPPPYRFRRRPSSLPSDRLSDDTRLEPAHSPRLGPSSPRGHSVMPVAVCLDGDVPGSPRGERRDSLTGAERTVAQSVPKTKSISEELSDCTYLSAVKLKDDAVGIKPGRRVPALRGFHFMNVATNALCPKVPILVMRCANTWDLRMLLYSL